MSAETLRRAAALMREDDQGPVIVAVADWLDVEADGFDALTVALPEFGGHRFCHRCDEGFVGGQCGCWVPALAVARAYLEETP